MTPSEFCKSAGLKSLGELSARSRVSVQTLINWHNNKPVLFAIVVAGAIALDSWLKEQHKLDKTH